VIIRCQDSFLARPRPHLNIIYYFKNNGLNILEIINRTGGYRLPGRPGNISLKNQFIEPFASGQAAVGVEYLEDSKQH
jgi:hypothetical protein